MMSRFLKVGLAVAAITLASVGCRREEPPTQPSGPTENHPPNTPSNPAPPDGAINQGIDLTLYWTGGDPDAGDTVQYSICFGIVTPPPMVATGLTTNSYDPGSLDYSAQYYWRVEARDNHNATSQGPIWSFITGSSPFVPPPTNLRIEVAGADSLSLRLSWDPPGQTVDGYIVSFGGSVIDTVATNYYQHTPSSLGTYSVRAYRGTCESTAIQTTSVLHEEAGEGPIYWMQDPDPGHPSCYGWDSNGNGSTYPWQSQYMDLIDLVLDADEDLRSPEDTFGVGWHITGIAYNVTWTYAGMTVAPLTGYFNSQNALVNGVYVLYLESGRYLKLEITEHDPSTHSIRFRFGFQRIAGFRRLG